MAPLMRPNSGIEPRSPTLQAYSLPAEPPEKPKNTGVDLPDSEIEPGSPAFQVDSLPAELPGKIVHDIKKRGEKSLPSILYSIGFNSLYLSTRWSLAL